MQLLIIGGTRFLGRALVETAVSAGHTVTLFNRGRSHPGLFPEVETIIGDRDGGLAQLAGRQWEAVIDTCGYVPRIVGDSVNFLAEAVGHYTFISTISVYANETEVGIHEGSEVGSLADESTEVINGETYGPLKVLCERAVTARMPGRSLLVRSGLIVGPHDLSDRFTYWPYRVAQGGEILAPGRPDYPVQIVDVRDIAAWTLQATEAGLSGPYNVTGPESRLTMGQVLHSCQQVSGVEATFTWVSDAFLEAQQVAAYTQMPLWIPERYLGMSQVDCRKALAQGLAFRPLSETVRDTLAWAQERPSTYTWRGGLTPAREAELLRLWRETAP